ASGYLPVAGSSAQQPFAFTTIMSVVQKFLAGLTPPQVVVPEEYDGWQLRWSIFVCRPARAFNSVLESSRQLTPIGISPQTRRVPFAGPAGIHSAGPIRKFSKLEKG